MRPVGSGSVRSCDRRAQSPGRRAWIGCLSDGADDDDAPGTGVEHLAESVFVNSSDGEPRLGGIGRRHLPHEIETGGGTTRFGGRRPARPHTEVVDVFGDGAGRVPDCVGGPADQGPGADDFPSGDQGQVVLTEVQDVGAGRAGDVGAIIDRQ